MLTADQLQSIMPGLPARRSGELLPFLQAAMTEFAIEAPARAAAFLAQLAHESGQFRFMEEIWGPTPAQRRYEPPGSLAADLGNTEPGDGKRFKGRGPIQITGRANYRRFGGLLGVDLESDPPRAAVLGLAFRIAGLFWSKKGLNELADVATADAFRAITKRINGGVNGLEDRKKFYAAARTVLGVPGEPLMGGTGRDLPGAGAAGEPGFERGHEAIRSHARRKRARQAAPAGRKPRTPAGRTAKKKTGPRRKTRKAAAPRGAARRAAKRRGPARPKARGRKR
jgi:predicted chitinase